jgi:hypothetical protein
MVALFNDSESSLGSGGLARSSAESKNHNSYNISNSNLLANGQLSGYLLSDTVVMASQKIDSTSLY